MNKFLQWAGIGGDVSKFTDQVFYDYIRDTKTLTMSTKNIYLNKLSTIQKKFFNPHKSLEWILQHPEQFKEVLIAYGKNNEGYLANTLSPSTLTSFVTTMSSLIKNIPNFKEKYPELLPQWILLKKEINAPVEQHYLSNQPNEKQKEGLMSFDEICDIRDQLEYGSIPRILISLYTLVPPVRADFGSLKIYNLPISKIDDQNNYLSINDKKIIIQKFKTAKNYHQITIDLPDILIKQIEQSLEQNPREYLFVGRQNNPYTNNGYDHFANRIVKRVLNPYFSLNLFRHIYLSRPDLDLKNKTGLERKELADKMSHSLPVQQRYIFMDK